MHCNELGDVQCAVNFAADADTWSKLLVFVTFVAVTKHCDQRQLKGEFIRADSSRGWDVCNNREGVAAGAGSSEITSQLFTQEREKELGGGQGCQLSKFLPSDVLSPLKPHLLKVPQLPQMEPPTEDHIVKYMSSLWTVLSHTTRLLNPNLRWFRDCPRYAV